MIKKNWDRYIIFGHWILQKYYYCYLFFRIVKVCLLAWHCDKIRGPPPKPNPYIGQDSWIPHSTNGGSQMRDPHYEKLKTRRSNLPNPSQICKPSSKTTAFNLDTHTETLSTAVVYTNLIPLVFSLPTSLSLSL